MIKSLVSTVFFYLASNFKRKMIALTILILIFIVGLIEIIIYNIDIPIQTRNAMAYNAQEVRYISERVDAVISNYDWFLNGLTMDDEVQMYLKKKYDSSLEEHLINFDLEQALIAKSSLSSNRFDQLFIYDTKKLRSRILNNFDYDRSYLTLDTDHFNNEGSVHWNVNDGKIFINRAIRDRVKLSLIGYITVAVSDKYLSELVQSATKRYTFVFNQNDQLVIQNTLDSSLTAGEVLSLSHRQSNGNPEIITMQSAEKMILITHTSQYSLWKTVSLIPLDEITSGPRYIAKWIVGVGLLGILLGTIIIWYSSSRLIRPLEELTEAIKDVDQDYGNLRVNIQRNDEFGRLGKSFNRMMQKIDYLISEVYEKELSRREAEYKALKAQINPHFLYNTLETIRCLAEFDEPDKVVTVTNSLGKLLKASIMNNKDTTTVSEEFEYIDAYLAIQNTRFQDKVEVIKYVESEVMELTIPRFILQPLIENAFLHGLETKIGKGNLIIKAFVKDAETLAFQIIDDGVGMDQETLSELFKKDRAVRPGHRGTGNGLLNVHNRLQLLYGDAYGLTVQSSPKVGTVIEVQLPIQTGRWESYVQSSDRG